jgi:putative peptidoglycan lipid II flippase
MLMSEPIIRLIFERGKFDHSDTINTAAALQYYAIGLMAYSGIKVVTPAFYALDKRHAPMIVSLASIALNAVLNYYLTFALGLGHRGLALSTGIVAVTNFVVLYILMRRACGPDPSREYAGFIAKLGLATLALGGAAWAGNDWLNAVSVRQPLTMRVAHMCLVMGIAAGLFFLVAWQLRIREFTEVLDSMARKFGRRRKPAGRT